jgi:hypothetical protein
MASDKQMRANRQNARKSTGPKTPEGKAVARLNALKHGLLSQQILLPNEDEASLMQLRGCADRRVANVSMGDEEPT